jgi:hypothetical protein
MTTKEIVRLFQARRAGSWKGKPAYQCKCPSHRDRMPSLSITEGRDGKTFLHCFRGCTIAEILSAKGMRLQDLFENSGFNPSPEMRRVWADEERLALLQRQHGLAIMAQAVLPDERHYWRTVERNIAVRGRALKDKLYPEETKRRDQAREAQRIISEYGFTELWECLP